MDPKINVKQVKQNIIGYSQYLVDNRRQVSLEQYSGDIRRNFLPTLDISFMKYFVEISDQDGEFVVRHTKLVEFGIIKNADTIAKIERCLTDSNRLIEGVHFDSSNVGRVKNPGAKGGPATQKLFMLTPEAFRACCMNSKNEIKYRQYYLFLEMIFKHYNYYSLHLREAIADDSLNMKDHKIDLQTKEINDLKVKMERMLERTDHIVNQNDDLNNKVATITTQNEEIKSQNVDLSEQVAGISVQNNILEYKVDTLVGTLNERNPKLPNENDQPMFCLVKILDRDNAYKVYRAAKSQIDRLISQNEDRYEVLINEFDPNPGNHFKRFTAFVKKELFEFITAIKRSEFIAKKQKQTLLGMYNTNPPIHICGTDIVINPQLMSEQRLLDRFDLINKIKYRVGGSLMTPNNAEA